MIRYCIRFIHTTKGCKNSIDLVYENFVKGKPSKTVSKKLIVPIEGKSSSYTIIDRWLLDSIDPQVSNSSHGTRCELRLATVLKTLQRLRSANKNDLYFQLLNKIHSTNINWIPKLRNAQLSVPDELYYEVSTMLYKLSITQNYEDNLLLSKFILCFLKDFNPTDKGNLQTRVRFFKNCLTPITKSGSMALVESGLKLLPTGDKVLTNTLTYLVLMSFYNETNQLLRLVDHIKHKEIMVHGVVDISIFESLLAKVLRNLLNNGLEEDAQYLLEKCVIDWNLRFNDHNISSFDELCRKFAYFRLLDKLSLLTNSVQPLEILPLKSNLFDNSAFEKFLSHWQGNQNKTNAEKCEGIDFAITKLPRTGSSLEVWSTRLEEILKYQEETLSEESTKKMTINLILTRLAGEKSFGFLLQILSKLYFELNFDIPLSQCVLTGMKKNSGYHTLFKSISSSSSAFMTGLKLFCFLQDFNYEFTTDDFKYLTSKANTLKTFDNQFSLTTFYSIQFLKLFGHNFYNKEEEKWSMRANDFGIFFEDSAIMKNVKKFYEASQGSIITDDTLRTIFGESYNDPTSINGVKEQLLPILRKNDSILNSYDDASNDYVLSIDLKYSEDLMALLDAIEE
ncbi:hypothetical protein KAFR_0C05140 [Kazachstania africana CBS 2517]|uniref:ATPase expression protein 1 n=1 Tax=Kazachstania africana (strain ATCC 22294 / BCRC 22015 / CBS 2517 / CECT 1963 / NBRC 1671 / NRRL Y-8276) TaxID=1071382 RepID=H2AT05_KAZAF|nr:hypothetical protein KAFR_0C05140 [Kazachstania africana CBS 2517]CCF57505.1 hypothetical protein KAFR_0C05140 [Kazachstania africana CBS 2517]